MESLKRLEPLWLLMLVIGGINYAWMNLFDTNLLSKVLGSGTLLEIAYDVMGFAALAMIPALMSHVHAEGWHMPHLPSH